MKENELTSQIIGHAMSVHSTLGPGLLESAYKACLLHKLTKSGFFVECERPIPLIYDDLKLDCGYRLDLLIERKIVIEIKSVEALNEVHLAQTLTYMKLGDYKLGLLINFNVVKLKDGIRRLINGSL